MFSSDVVIGLEIHIQLNTKTKLFSSASTSGGEPNSSCFPVDVGLPGSKPVLNKIAVEQALKLCLASNCKIANELIFSRKSYFYPDLGKNYQITQYEEPLGEGGFIILSSGKRINLTRIHLEEDPASLVHPSGIGDGMVLVDYNRSGNPLCELVTEPQLESPEEARDFLKQLMATLQYLKIYGGMIKADANISIKEKNYTRVEIKNITGFKEIERALNYEIKRQKEGDVVQETRGWNSDLGKTISLRKKETEDEYGYILEPDIPIMDITEEMKSISLPELPTQKAERFIKLGITREDAFIICQNFELSEIFEKSIEKVTPALAVTWIRHELNRVLNYNKKTLEDVNLDETQMVSLLNLIQTKKITENSAKKILNKLVLKTFDVEQYVKSEGLETLSDSNQIENICKKILDENKSVVDDYKSGNEKSLNFLVGQVMRQTRGAASPDLVIDLIKKLIE